VFTLSLVQKEKKKETNKQQNKQ